MTTATTEPLRRYLLRAAMLLALLGGGLPPGAAAQELTVFAAASLHNVLDELGRLYRDRTGRVIRFSFAGTGALARQIEQGAPAAVFISADEQWMDWLARRRLIVEATRRPLLSNRLVLAVPTSNPVTLELVPGVDLSALLGRDGRWVTGDPSGVPVGRYAQQALTSLGAWDLLRRRLVRAENARVALAFVERGEAAFGVVYETDAMASPRVRIAGIFPAEAHAPISYPVAVVTRHDSPAARDLLRFLDGDAARAVFRRHGFTQR